MSEEAKVGEQSPTMNKLGPVTCIAFLDKKGRRRNLRWALGKTANIKRMTLLQMLGPTQHNGKLSIIGGGPSLNDTYKEISGDSMVCGTAHDHVVKLGINPTYAIECDPSLGQINYYKENPKGTKYLICSRCDRTMFKHLNGRDIYLWHMWESDLGKIPYRGEPAFICGATVLLAAIPVALSLGYKELHFYGCDSSFPSLDRHHAYKNVEENAQVIEVAVGKEDGEKYTTTATWVGQAQQYQDMVNNWGHLFKGHFHGEGMLGAMERHAGRQ